MARPGDVLELPKLGVRVEFRQTAEETGGELLEFDVVGRPRGFLVQAHVHPGQSEHHEVIEGEMRIKLGSTTRVLGPGETIETPPGTRHSHMPAGDGPGRVRVQLRPAGRTEAWLERIAAMERDGQVLGGGWPRPIAGARLLRDFAGEAHAAAVPPRVQQGLARALLRGRALFDNEYVFVDEWDVAAPIEAVFEALADARTYPEWWTPVYLEAHADGPAAVGHVSTQRFKGRLPYRLNTRTTTIRHDPPTVLEGDVEGDLRGRGVWTLTPLGDGGTHVRFDWRVFADRLLLRVLTPVMRPAFAWNHAWAIARARDGLEPYARRLAARPRRTVTA
jgi:quercetin dioxygenase-like cupin family protein/uncharacterized protein YndB with AHSA1/START domain